MKKKILTLLSVGALLIAAQSAQANHSHIGGSKPVYSARNLPEMIDYRNWAIQGLGSVGWQSPSRFGHFEDDFDGLKSEYDMGWDISMALAYMFMLGQHHFEAQTEWYMQRSNIDSITITNVGLASETGDVGGHLRQHAWMFNLLYVLPFNNPLSLYFGGGIGAAWQHYEHSEVILGATQTLCSEDAVHAFAFQLLAGATWNVTDQIALVLGYRLFATTKAFKAVVNGLEVGTCPVNEVPYSNNVEIGVRVRF